MSLKMKNAMRQQSRIATKVRIKIVMAMDAKIQSQIALMAKISKRLFCGWKQWQWIASSNNQNDNTMKIMKVTGEHRSDLCLPVHRGAMEKHIRSAQQKKENIMIYNPGTTWGDQTKEDRHNLHPPQGNGMDNNQTNHDDGYQHPNTIQIWQQKRPEKKGSMDGSRSCVQKTETTAQQAVCNWTKNAAYHADKWGMKRSPSIFDVFELKEMQKIKRCKCRNSWHLCIYKTKEETNTPKMALGLVSVFILQHWLMQRKCKKQLSLLTSLGGIHACQHQQSAIHQTRGGPP